jgi:WD40 repeat protein
MEPVTISHDKATNKILVGLDDGVIDVVQVTSNGYEDVASFKAHQNKVTGVAFDALSNVVFSVSLDKVFRVSHGSSIALIVGIPHK